MSWLPGHREDRCAQAVEEGAGGAELARAGAHGEVAADRDQVGRVGVQLGRERLHHRRVGEEEVQVGDVGDAAHRSRTSRQPRRRGWLGWPARIPSGAQESGHGARLQQQRRGVAPAHPAASPRSLARRPRTAGPAARWLGPSTTPPRARPGVARARARAGARRRSPARPLGRARGPLRPPPAAGRCGAAGCPGAAGSAGAGTGPRPPRRPAGRGRLALAGSPGEDRLHQRPAQHLGAGAVEPVVRPDQARREGLQALARLARHVVVDRDDELPDQRGEAQRGRSVWPSPARWATRDMTQAVPSPGSPIPLTSSKRSSTR